MSVGQVAVRYAKALFQSAREQERLDEVRDDMKLLLESVKSIPDLNNLLHSPIVDTSKKTAILEEVYKSRMSPLGLDFLRLACINKREEYLPGMARRYIDLYKEEKGIKVARITSAVALDPENSEEIRELIKTAFKSEIELEHETREELIGGFVLRVDDKQLDASVKGELARIRKELQK